METQSQEKIESKTLTSDQIRKKKLVYVSLLGLSLSIEVPEYIELDKAGKTEVLDYKLDEQIKKIKEMMKSLESTAV